MEYEIPGEEEEDIDLTGSVLPATRRRVAGRALTSTVKPGAMRPSDSYRQLGQQFTLSGLAGWQTEPDVSQIEAYGARRQEDSRQAMIGALAAQYAGENFSGVQGALLKQAMSKSDPVKFGNAGYLENGKFVRDPYDAGEKRAAKMLELGRQYTDMANDYDIAEQRRIAAAANAASLSSSRESAEQARIWRGEDTLRSGYTKAVDDLEGTIAEADKVLELRAQFPDPSKMPAVYQQSMIILLNKFLDPNSVVREAEFDRVREAIGLMGKAQTFAANLLEGKPLNSQTMKDIARLAELYKEAATQKIRRQQDNYSGIARQRGFDVEAVIPGYSGQQQPSAQPRRVVRFEDLVKGQ